MVFCRAYFCFKHLLLFHVHVCIYTHNFIFVLYVDMRAHMCAPRTCAHWFLPDLTASGYIMVFSTFRRASLELDTITI